MNLDAFWQKNKRVVLGCLGGVVVFFVLLSVLTSGARERQEKARRQISAANRELREARFGPDQVRALESSLRELEASNARLAEWALPPLRDDFRLPPGKAPSQHYIELTGGLRQELVAWALRRNCEVDETLGLPAVSPTQAHQVERTLRGLDVVERVVRLAVAGGARRVERLSIAERVRRGGRKRAQALDLVPVHVEVVFEGASPTPFLRALLAEAEAGRPLGLAGLDVLEPQTRRNERRVVLDFAVGSREEALAAEEEATP